MAVQIIKTTMPDLYRKFAIDARFILRNGSAILRKGIIKDFDLPRLEETFKVLFDEDVIYVDKYKPEYKINYRKDDLVFNITALVNIIFMHV
jgi:3',5'-cyclic AMP phosphodiesterase CpdA